VLNLSAQATTALDQAVGWDQLKPDMIKLYTSTFNGTGNAGADPLLRVPSRQESIKNATLIQQSALLTQSKLESAVPKVNQCSLK
jgi:hypothetical protein